MAAGWTLLEAIETIVDPDLRAEWEEASAQRRNLPVRSDIAVLGGGEDSDLYIDSGEAVHGARLTAADERLREARRAVFNDLKDLMRHTPLVALGRAGGVTGPRKQIEKSQWVALTEFDEAGSAVFEADGSGFRGVIIYPSLEAPEAASLIEPCTLASALLDYVLRDPEVSSLINGVKGGPLVTLRDVVGSSGDGRCLVHVTDDASAIEKDLNSFQEPVGNWWWGRTHGVRVNTLASRLAALHRLLLRGDLQATGVADGDEEEIATEISCENLRKLSMSLCLATGDFWQAGATPRRAYHAVRIGPANGEKSPNMRGRPSADYEDAVVEIIRKAFRGELEGKIAQTASLVEEVQKSLAKAGCRRAADTVKGELKSNPFFRVVWEAARSGNRRGPNREP